MQKADITVTGRHVEVTEAIRDFAVKKIEAIHIDYPKIIEARVIVDVQKDRQICEIILFCSDHITIEASTVGADLYAAIDETVTKIMRRMRKIFSGLFMFCYFYFFLVLFAINNVALFYIFVVLW